MEIPDTLSAISDAQFGIVHRHQLAEAGLTRGQVRWALGRSWRAVLPGVVSLFTGALDPRQRLVAGQLYAGPDAVVASLSALRWHGVGAVEDGGLVRFLSPARQSVRSVAFVRVGRTRRPDVQPWRRGPLVISSRARAIADAARDVRHTDTARALVIEALQRRLVRVDDIAHEIEAGPVRHSAAARRALREATAGAWSVPEADMLRHLEASRALPRVWANPVLTTPDRTVLPSPDGWIDEVALAIQVHSRAYHLRDDDWEATVEGDTLLGEIGVVVVAVTPSSLQRDPKRFVRRVEAAYAALARGRTRPDVTMTPRAVGAGMGASEWWL